MKKSLLFLALGALAFAGCGDEGSDPAFGVTVTGDGFDIDKPVTILAAKIQEKTPVKVKIEANGGIDKMLVEITSSSELFNIAVTNMGMGGEFDIANPSEALDARLDNMLPHGNEVKGKPSLLFDITNFMPMLYETAGLCTAEFKLTVHDTKGNIDSKTLKVRIVTDRLINGGFEDWNYNLYGSNDVANQRIWYPSKNLYKRVDLYTETEFWDTANEGLSILGMAGPIGPKSITLFDETDKRPGTTGTRSVKMKTAVFMQRFATGNIYTGDFDKLSTNPTGANVKFGRLFSGRPKALKGWYKASPGTITHATEGAPKQVGDPDEYQIFILLTNWDTPRDVNTSLPETLIDFNADYVIGFGQISDNAAIDTTQPVTEWTEFNIPVVYKSQAEPTCIVVVACASRYGDYLTGSTASVLQIDDFELVYE